MTSGVLQHLNQMANSAAKSQIILVFNVTQSVYLTAKGFYVGGDVGTVVLYEKLEDQLQQNEIACL
jgi:hypothetical protein